MCEWCISTMPPTDSCPGMLQHCSFQTDVSCTRHAVLQLVQALDQHVSALQHLFLMCQACISSVHDTGTASHSHCKCCPGCQ